MPLRPRWNGAYADDALLRPVSRFVAALHFRIRQHRTLSDCPAFAGARRPPGISPHLY